MSKLPDVQPGEIIASEHINDIADRTVQRYASPAQRDLENPIPEVGDVAFLTDTGTLQIWSGTDWDLAIFEGIIRAKAGGGGLDETNVAYGFNNDAGTGFWRTSASGSARINVALNSAEIARFHENAVKVQTATDAGYLAIQSTVGSGATHDFRFSLQSDGTLRLQSSPKGTETWSTIEVWNAL